VERTPPDITPGDERGTRHAATRPARSGTAAIGRRSAIGMAGSAAALAAGAVVVARSNGTPAPGTTTTTSTGVAAGAVEADTAAGATLARGAAAAAPAGAAPAAAAPAAGTAGKLGATGAVAAAGNRTAEFKAAGTGSAPRAAVLPKVKQPPTILSRDPALHLARRATWGPTPAVVRGIRQMGAQKWLDQQLRPERIPDPLVNRLLAPFDTLGMRPAQLRAIEEQRAKQDYWFQHSQLENAAILRAAWSNRQLFEVVVDFFHSRLHVPGFFDKSRHTLNHYDVAVIRKHAFGTFFDMVWASVTHPAMILYLDNQHNNKDGGNQNLGRELLELHTLGVDAGYRHSDVVGAALLLTGFSVDDKTHERMYRPEQHYVGKVRVFGKVYANASAAAGPATLRALVRDLAFHPRTAHYFALDLARRFVSDAPPEALVKRLAAVYLQNKTAIVPVLRALFASPEFAASVGQKYRRPFESGVASIRALGIGPGPQDKLRDSLSGMRYGLERAGQSPLGRTSPDGFPDFARPWLSSFGMLARWNNQMGLSGGWSPGFTKPPVDTFLAGATTYGAAVDKLVQRLQFQPATPTQRAALLKFLGKRANAPLNDDMRKNDYNLRVRLPALILGGPHHQLR